MMLIYAIICGGRLHVRKTRRRWPRHLVAVRIDFIDYLIHRKVMRLLWMRID